MTFKRNKSVLARQPWLMVLPLVAALFVLVLAWLIRSWIIRPVVLAHPETLDLWQQAELGFVMMVLIAAMIASLSVLLALVLLQRPLHDLAEGIALSAMADQPVALPASGNAATAIIVQRYNALVAAVQRSSQALQLRVVESEGLSSQILAAVPSGIIATDAEGHVLRMNAGGESILQVQAEAVLGQSLADILDQDHPLLLALQHPGQRAEAKLVIDGQERILEIFSAHLPALKQQQSGGGVVVFSDLTEIHALREALEMKERLASLGELAAGLAHELRNPLAALRGFVELLEGRLEQPERAQKLLGQITRESDSLAAVVGDFLAFARVSPPQWQQVDVQILLHDALAAGLSATSALRQSSVTVQQGAELVLADQGQLHRALVNFVINACQATQENGRIALEARLHEQQIVLSVDDDGPGIDPSLSGRLPTPFLTSKASGTGLGLAVCHQIAQAHGGRLQIAEADLGGARVSLFLPGPGQEHLLHRSVMNNKNTKIINNNIMLPLNDTKKNQE